jgi:hypothetical protein
MDEVERVRRVFAMTRNGAALRTSSQENFTHHCTLAPLWER